MKASFYEGNKRFSVNECNKELPGEKEVQIKIAYCGICGTDMHIYHGNMDNRVKAHQTIGHECSGEVVALGEGTVGFSIGDRVVVRPLDYCGKCPACLAGHSHICQDRKSVV